MECVFCKKAQIICDIGLFRNAHDFDLSFVVVLSEQTLNQLFGVFKRVEFNKDTTYFRSDSLGLGIDNEGLHNRNYANDFSYDVIIYFLIVAFVQILGRFWVNHIEDFHDSSDGD